MIGKRVRVSTIDVSQGPAVVRGKPVTAFLVFGFLQVRFDEDPIQLVFTQVGQGVRPFVGADESFVFPLVGICQDSRSVD
jgi:hypothetical protein